jgi:hypothetical protein
LFDDRSLTPSNHGAKITQLCFSLFYVWLGTLYGVYPTKNKF